MESQRNKALLIPPFLAFYVVHSLQIGIGALSFPRDITKIAGYQSFPAIIWTGLIFHIIIWMIYSILKDQGEDIVSIQRSIFGKWISFLPTLILSIYWLISSVSILRTYILIVQIWMFPQLKTWMLALAMLGIVYYAILKGFRVVVGLCVLGVILPFFLIFTPIYLIEYSTFRNLLPLFHTTTYDQLLTIKQMSYSFAGPEILLIAYPFIQEARKSQKFAHLANFLTTLTYLFIAFFTFSFFSEGQIVDIYFPTLTSWKIVNLPFIERFEYLGIAIWMTALLPNITLTAWAISRLLKHQLNIKQRYTLQFALVVIFITILFYQTTEEIVALSSFTSQFGMYILWIYIPLLFIILLIKRKVKK